MIIWRSPASKCDAFMGTLKLFIHKPCVKTFGTNVDTRVMCDDLEAGTNDRVTTTQLGLLISINRHGIE